MNPIIVFLIGIGAVAIFFGLLALKDSRKKAS